MCRDKWKKQTIKMITKTQVSNSDYARIRKSDNFLESNIFHAKTFRIECINCKIVKFATKLRKTALSTPIPMKERIWFMFGKICIYIVRHMLSIIWTFVRLSGHFLDPPDTLHTIWIPCTSSGPLSDHWHHFQIIGTLSRSSGVSRHFSYHPNTFQDTLQIIWTLFI